LATNLLKKELRGAVGGGMQGVYDAGLAINCVSNIVTEDLARDLLSDLTSLTSHPQPYLRKKAILCLFKLFVKYPQGLRLTFARLQQCLEDPNSSVVSCAVNVITELSDKNPKNYLHLAPAFFQLLTHSSNNWMLIKVVKLLGSLVPEEPRLARKLLTPLSAIVRNTQAKSLLYESVRTITLCLPYCQKADGTMPSNVPEIVELCANTLLDFVTQADQNLKYLGLVGFGSLMQSHPQVLSDPKYRPLILTCLSDQDVTIRSRALDLLTAMATRKNLMELVTQLLRHVELASGNYKNDLVAKIIEMCSGDKYSRMPDFKWYLDVIFQLGHARGIEKHGDLLRAQITNISLRVVPVRPYAVRRCMEILLESDGDASDDPFGDNGRGRHLMTQLLPGVAWTIGEYSDQIRSALSIDPDDLDDVDFIFDENSQGTYHAVVQCLTCPLNTQKLPASTQSVYVQAAMKVFAAASSEKLVRDSELEACVSTILFNLPVYLQSTNVEVVERSFTLLELLKSLGLSRTTDWTDSRSTKAVSNERDLLGMGAESSTPSSVQTMSHSATVRDASGTLVYLLKPSPMKPPPPKSLKNKRQAPIGVEVDVDAPVDLSIFQALIAEEEAYRASISSSLEAVSFTQQVPYRAEEPKSMRSFPVLGSTTNVALSGGNINDTPAVSFQRPNSGSRGSSLSRLRRDDPFYLEGAPPSENVDSGGANINRFGTIQLPNTSDDDSAEAKDARRQRRKHKKTKKAVADWQSNVATLDSYDDDDDEDEAPPLMTGKKKGFTSDFDGLAKVDLTTPLRDDEVVPERTHRVVPERPIEQVLRKKSKKAKKTKSTLKTSAPSSLMGDLLDLDGTMSTIPGRPATSILPSGSASMSNPISTAFDDLLSMPMPHSTIHSQRDSLPAPNTNNVTLVDFSSLENYATLNERYQAWIRATLKDQPKPTTGVNWAGLSIQFQALKVSEGAKVGALIVVRIENTSQEPMHGVSVDFRDFGRFSFSAIGPMSSSTSSDKLGPIFYETSDTGKEVKGSLTIANETAQIKLNLPAVLLLNPLSNMSLEVVAQEMGVPGWASSTAKVHLGPINSPKDAKNAIACFLRSDLVVGSAGNETTATYASQSSVGVPVRVLVKVKETYVKVDIKSTSSSLCKALASDLKRLVFMPS
jgi:AP-3 complex subunit delta